MRAIWAASLTFTVLQFPLPAHGQEAQQAVRLGRPQAVPAAVDPVSSTRPAPSALIPVGYTPVANAPGSHSSSVSNWQNPAPDFPAPPPPPPVGAPVFPGSLGPNENYNCGVATQNPGSEHPFRQWLQGLGGTPDSSRKRFSSDRNFEVFSSPITNPFFFEDPRSLTELRPIGMYQKIPGRNSVFTGGDIEQFALQGRLALNDCWSIVVNKLGWTWINTDSALPAFQGENGFSELWLGPKFTFLRSEKKSDWWGQSLGAVGLTFQIPVGSGKVFQDTGDLSLVPYVSFGQNFCGSRYGSFNALANVGYSFGVDNQRSDFFYTSLHLDYNVGNANRLWPMIELNWFHYTSNGNNLPLSFEGRDLINFGSMNAKGRDEVSLAAGARFQINSCWSIAAAAEFPVTGKDALMDFRITLDMIFRF